MNKTVLPGSRSGALRIPSSKSVIHRLLICAALGCNDVRIRFEGLSKDILATAECLSALGADVQTGENELRITQAERQQTGERAVLPTGESGSTLRFLLPLAGALGRSAEFVMQGRLSERPLAPFDRLLTEHGMVIRKEGQHLLSDGQLRGGRFCLPGNISSQFFSGLLMALPLLQEDSILETDGPLESSGYVQLTEEILRRAEIDFEKSQDKLWRIPGRQHSRLPAVIDAEGDWSNAAFFLCAGALSERGIRVSGLNRQSSQGDREILSILRRMGAEVTEAGDSVSVRKKALRPVSVDAGAIPDLVPVLAVLCCACSGESEIRGAARLRLKESDRLQSTAGLIRRLGGSAEELPDGLVIRGSGVLKGGTADACNDHRIAMSAAVAACMCTGTVKLSGAECVDKSYPAFWQDFESLARETAEGPAQEQERS